MKQSKILPYLVAVICSGGALHSMAEESTNSSTLGEVTVTGTREGRALAETPASVGVVKADEIRNTSPKHPSEIMGQIPGVWVNVTGGEGHQTAIRQPLTTSPVYLYLEDGVPTRSTGFFNHNALYEINLPMAGGIEVSKGPGTALYGSDAIGGVVNVLTRPAPLKPEAQITAEAGEFGWGRIMVTGGNTIGDNGFRADFNVTHTDGWRNATGYDRQSGTVRWDKTLGSDAALKTVATFSNIDQQTAGSSAISEADYNSNPTINYTPISLRKVQAFRLSSAYEKESGNSLLSVTPYFRYNDMDLLANWSLSYDPTIYNTNNKSLGLLTKYRVDLPNQRARVIVGLDLDYSPGSRNEQSITPTKDGKIYTSYTLGPTIYNYDVTFKEASPYVHGEISASDRLRLTAGLRYDHLGYDYDNQLSTIQTGSYRRPGDMSVTYNHASPKLGATYAFSPSLSAFAAYNHAFRAPSESQLFRQGSALNTVDLKPVKADSYEIGFRGNAGANLRYEASIYYMTKRDDILSYKDPATGATQSVNAGETLHQGIELGLAADLSQQFELNVSASYAKHTYDDWVTKVGSGNVDYSGKEMETAPRLIANTRLNFKPAILNGGRLSLEWVKLGEYWMDAANTQKYDGHDIFNLRVNYPLSKQVELLGSITNLSDERYAESAAYKTTSGKEFAPGMPRTIYAGVRYNWL